MCTDHPTVQDLVGRIEDRRIITYGENPQADVRLIDVDLRGGRRRFRVLIRDRATRHRSRSRTWCCRCPATTTRSTPRPRSRSRTNSASSRTRSAGRSRASAASSAASPAPASGTASTIFDDYGHHPVEIAAVLRAARASTEGQVIAVVQPHRYTRLSSLFNQFCTCFNDADAVIVAPVYAAGEQPIPGADRDASWPASRRAATATRLALEAPEDLAGLVGGLAGPGDYVVCLGAGNITQWAYALPDELQALGDKAA